MSELSHYIKLRSGLSGCNAKQFECDKYLDCDSCLEDKIKEHDKQVIEQYKENTKLKDTIRDIHDNVAREMYCKGIDDMCTEISSYFTYGHCGNVIDVFEIADKLKAGGKNV